MNFNKLGIYELRNIAREFGVCRPTTLKKAEIIAEIEKIKNGEVKPCLNNRKGRPPIFQSTFAEESIKNQIRKFYAFAKNLAIEFNVDV